MNKLPEPLVGAAYDSLQAVLQRAGNNKEHFLGDGLLQDATLMRLMDAGEQLARIREDYPDYYVTHATAAWDKLIGLRNIIAHGYLIIDFEIVWDIIQNYLPEAITDLKTLID